MAARKLKGTREPIDDSTNAEAEKRLVADVPERIHRQVRIKCLHRGVLVKDYILELLAKDGIA